MQASDVAVLISTFGNEDRWGPMALAAMESLSTQTMRPQAIWSHMDALHSARNACAKRTDAEWLIFLDADDSLDDGYVEAMVKGTGDIRRPSLQKVVDGHLIGEPYLPADYDLYTTNYIPIGAMCRHDIFDRVGGFRELPALEDWDLWLRMYRHGAAIVSVPEAVYRVTERLDSRNQDVEAHNRAYSMIRGLYQ